ncbi:hypothetical protein C4J81_09260 [Deltaproteobacteria bacterium Smac51]|nr:hypothetical protein C4J81_09260 [Deltaproteobacteria bacterium Smac51]
MKAPLYVISDLHMGAAERASKKRHKGDQAMSRDNFEVWSHGRHMLEFIDYLEKQPSASLLILGDLFEFWQTPIAEVLEVRKPLLDRLAKFGNDNPDRLKFVVGNHDADFRAFVNHTQWLNHSFFKHLSPPFMDTIGGKPYYFLHGHEGDPFNSGTFPVSGRALAILAAMVEDWAGSPYLDPPKCKYGVQVCLTEIGEALLELWNWMTKELVLRHSGGVEGGLEGSGASTVSGRSPEEFWGSPDMISLERQLLQRSWQANQVAVPNDRALPDGACRPGDDLAIRYLTAALNEFARRKGCADQESGERGNGGSPETCDENDQADGFKPNKLLKDHLAQISKIREEQGGKCNIVAGHTHIACRYQDWYFNSGAWTEREFGQIVVIAESGAPALFEWKNKGLSPVAWPVVNEK